MPEYGSPGVYLGQLPPLRRIRAAPTSVAGIVGSFASGPLGRAIRVSSTAEFERIFGDSPGRHECAHVVRQFFINGGGQAWIVRVADAEAGAPAEDMLAVSDSGLHALQAVGEALGMLLVPSAAGLPADTMRAVYLALIRLARQRHAMAILDVGPGVDSARAMQAWLRDNAQLRSPNSCVYFPRLLIADPEAGNALRNIGASGSVAGCWARNDLVSAVWTAPAGSRARLTGLSRLALDVTGAEQGPLNRLGANVLRHFPGRGDLVWGGRTLAGADGASSEWRYLAVRRLALFLEQSIESSLEWTAAERNGEPLWQRIRQLVSAFLEQLYRLGAFQGSKPADAYFVRCGLDTMAQADIRSGRLAGLVGFAPLRPAEFVLLRFQRSVAGGM